LKLKVTLLEILKETDKHRKRLINKKSYEFVLEIMSNLLNIENKWETSYFGP
jgi:hypothetical protein